MVHRKLKPWAKKLNMVILVTLCIIGMMAAEGYNLKLAVTCTIIACWHLYIFITIGK